MVVTSSLGQKGIGTVVDHTSDKKIQSVRLHTRHYRVVPGFDLKGLPFSTTCKKVYEWTVGILEKSFYRKVPETGKRLT